MPSSQVEITLSLSGQPVVKINGTEIPDVTWVSLCNGANHLPYLELSIRPESVRIIGDVLGLDIDQGEPKNTRNPSWQPSRRNFGVHN